MNIKQGLWAAVTVGLLASGSSQARADCTLVLSNPSIDFGTLNRTRLNLQAGELQLGLRSLSLNISCDSPGDMTLFYRATKHNTERFRLGSLGHYSVRIRDAVLDGESVELGEVFQPGTHPTQADSALTWRPERGIAPMSAGWVVQGSTLQAQLDIIAQAPEAALRVRDETRWQEPALIDMLTGGASRELSVQSTIMPVSCVPTLSNSGQAHFGNRSAQALNRTANTPLTPQTLELNVNCDAPVRFALRTLDNRNGSAVGTAQSDFGLGLDTRGTPIGQYRISLDNVRTDRLSRVYLSESTSAGAAWSAAHSGASLMAKNSWLGFTDIAGSTAGAVELEQLSATLSVAPVIASTVGLDLRSAVDLDGSATIEIIYL